MKTDRRNSEERVKRNWWKLAAVALRNLANLLEEIGDEEF